MPPPPVRYYVRCDNLTITHSCVLSDRLYSVGLTTSDPPSVLVILLLYVCLDHCCHMLQSDVSQYLLAIALILPLFSTHLL